MKLRLPVVLSKFLQAAPISPPDFLNQWRVLSGPPLKLQEVVCPLSGVLCLHPCRRMVTWACYNIDILEQVRGVKPLAIPEMGGLLNGLHIAVAPGLVSTLLRV